MALSLSADVPCMTQISHKPRTWESIYWASRRRGDDPAYSLFLADEWQKRQERKQMSENAVPQQAPRQVPSVGRMVHYVLEAGPNQGEHRAATVVRVFPDPDGIIGPDAAIVVHVHVDSPGDFYQHQGPEPLIVQRHPAYDGGCNPGTWHWPEHVNASTYRG